MFRGEGVLLARFPFMRQKEARVTPSAAGTASLPGALESARSARFPFGDRPSTPRAPPWRRASPCLCSPPVLALEDRRPGPAHPDSSRSPGLLRSGTGLPALHPALPCSPHGPLLRAPLRSSPFETASALGPPASGGPPPRFSRPGPSPQHEKKVSTQPGRRPQLSLYFSRLRCMYCQKGGVGMLMVTAKVWFQIVFQCLQKLQFRSQYINSSPMCFSKLVIIR